MKRKTKKNICFMLISVFSIFIVACGSQKTEIESSPPIITGEIEKGALWASYLSIEEFIVKEGSLKLRLEEPFYHAASIYTLGNPTDIMEIEYPLQEECKWFTGSTRASGGYASIIDKDTILEIKETEFVERLSLEEKASDIKFVSIKLAEGQIIEVYMVVDSLEAGLTEDELLLEELNDTQESTGEDNEK